MSGRRNVLLRGLGRRLSPLAVGVLVSAGSLIAVMIADAMVGSHANPPASTASEHGRGHMADGRACEHQSAMAYASHYGTPPPPPSGPCLTLEKLQKVGSGSFTTSELTAKEGETVDYEIIARNTGDGELTLSALTDTKCTNIIGGASKLASGASTTWSCEHKLTRTGEYSNVASIEACEAVHKERCHGRSHEALGRCDHGKKHGAGHKRGFDCKGRSLGKKQSNAVTVNVTTSNDHDDDHNADDHDYDRGVDDHNADDHDYDRRVDDHHDADNHDDHHDADNHDDHHDADNHDDHHDADNHDDHRGADNNYNDHRRVDDHHDNRRNGRNGRNRPDGSDRPSRRDRRDRRNRPQRRNRRDRPQRRGRRNRPGGPDRRDRTRRRNWADRRDGVLRRSGHQRPHREGFLLGGDIWLGHAQQGICGDDLVPAATLGGSRLESRPLHRNRGRRHRRMPRYSTGAGRR